MSSCRSSVPVSVGGALCQMMNVRRFVVDYPFPIFVVVSHRVGVGRALLFRLLSIRVFVRLEPFCLTVWRSVE